MKHTNIGFAFFAALTLTACATTPEPVQAPVQSAVCEVSSKDERDFAAQNGFQFRSLSGEAARKFVVATGGADAPFLKDIELVQLFSGVRPGAIVVSAYDRNGCKLGGAVLPENLVLGKTA